MVNIEKISETAMTVITYSGMAKSCYMEALELAKQGKFAESDEKMNEGSGHFLEAHHGHADVLAEEMSKEELMKITVEEFSRLQDWMLLSEKDSEAYKGMKKRYDELKVILASLNVNITGIDKIKE